MSVDFAKSRKNANPATTNRIVIMAEIFKINFD